MRFHFLALCLNILVYCITPQANLSAQANPAWLDDQTVAVARLSFDSPAKGEALLDLLAQTVKPATNEINIWKSQLAAISQAIQAGGGKEVIIVYSMADSFADQPLLVFPGMKSLNMETLANTFLGNGVLRSARTSRKLTVATIGGDSLVGTSSALTRINSRKSATVNARLNRSTADNLLTLTATLNSDQRRAASEIAGALPTVLGNGTFGDLLTEVEIVQVDVTKNNSVAITLLGKSAAIEARLRTIKANLAQDEKLANSARATLGKYLVDQLVSQTPLRQDDSITYTLPLAEAMQSDLGVALGKAILESDRLTATYKLRVLGIALHNFYSAHNKFPSVTLGANGKPRTLSWRVDLLPFLDQGALWKEFHHDEPWDSAHNKQLIARMPDVFRCPHSKHALSSGLSTFVLPVHEKAMWSKTWETEFKGIEDGTSNTIMIVDARDELAQVWTKPDPFEIDMSAPEKQLGGHFEGAILFGRGDSSADTLPSDKFQWLPALLTRAGGEVTGF